MAESKETLMASGLAHQGRNLLGGVLISLMIENDSEHQSEKHIATLENSLAASYRSDSADRMIPRYSQEREKHAHERPCPGPFIISIKGARGWITHKGNIPS